MFIQLLKNVRQCINTLENFITQKNPLNFASKSFMHQSSSEHIPLIIVFAVPHCILYFRVAVNVRTSQFLHGVHILKIIHKAH